MTKTLNHDLIDFLDSLCRNQGFCSIRGNDRLRIINARSLSADEFAMAVLKGEGFPDPENEVKWRRNLKRAFIDRYGTDFISAEAFEADQDRTQA